jgi:CHAT domain-containing protein
MNPQDFLDRLLALPNTERQRAWLQTQTDTLTLEHFESFKARSDSLALEHPRRALEIAEAALLAASLADLPLEAAVAHWARGNAWLCMGEYQHAYADYEQACNGYQAQDRERYRLEIARLQTNMIEALKNLGRYEAALSLAETARETLQPWAESRYMATLEMNVGSLNRLLGRYETALAAYERGRATFSALDNQVQIARMDINRARILGLVDRFDEAATLLRRAREKLTALDKRLPAARATLNLATLQSRQGHHRRALALYREARADFAALEDQTDVAVTALYMTYDYLALNLLPEALETAARAQEMLEKQQMPRYVALAAANWAVAARKQGHYSEALSTLMAARTFFVTHGVKSEIAKIDLERVVCLREMGETSEALEVAEDAVQRLTHQPLPLLTAQAQLALADTLLETKQAEHIEASAAHYAQALETTRDFPALSWHAYRGLGGVAEARGQIQQAFERYRQAIACLEQVEASLGLTELQAGFLADKLDVYRRAIAVALALQAEDTAFDLAQRAKTGVWRTFLAAPPTEETDTLYSLRDRWHWLYQRLTRLESKEQNAEGHGEPTLDQQRGNTQAQWADLKAVEQQIGEVRRAHPPSSPALPVPSLSEIQAHIPNGVILLDYVWMQDTIAVFVVDRHQTHVIEDIAPSHIITRLINQWRFNLESVHLALLDQQATLGVGLANEAHDILRGLYRYLIEPVSAHLEGHTSVWIVPHGELWEVPFAALHDGQAYLVEQLTVVNVPGLLASEPAPYRTPEPVAKRPVVVGYSDEGRLNQALHEAETVAALWDGATVLLEETSTVSRLREAASECTLLHLATHGVFRQDAPLFSALHLTDGALTANDLEAWRMPNIELVTLSACETGMHVSWGSDLLGLARGFWRAGAQRLVVSLWAVDDASTADLMAHFYTALQEGHSVASALQSAQTNALVKYRHPFYWAGFTLLELAM